MVQHPTMSSSSSSSVPRLTLSIGQRHGVPSNSASLATALPIGQRVNTLTTDPDHEQLKFISIAAGQALINDTTLFLKDATQIPLAISAINLFSEASGLNLQKCELSVIKDCADLLFIISLDPKLGQTINQLLFTFLWKRSVHHI